MAAYAIYGNFENIQKIQNLFCLNVNALHLLLKKIAHYMKSLGVHSIYETIHRVKKKNFYSQFFLLTEL